MDLQAHRRSLLRHVSHDLRISAGERVARADLRFPGYQGRCGRPRRILPRLRRPGGPVGTLRGAQQRPVLRDGRHACGQRLVVELRPAGTGSPGGMDQAVGHRIHGGWADLPRQWQDGHGASHLSQSVMIKRSPVLHAGSPESHSGVTGPGHVTGCKVFRCRPIRWGATRPMISRTSGRLGSSTGWSRVGQLGISTSASAAHPLRRRWPTRPRMQTPPMLIEIGSSPTFHAWSRHRSRTEGRAYERSILAGLILVRPASLIVSFGNALTHS